jgi:pilus assembly protein FimV
VTVADAGVASEAAGWAARIQESLDVGHSHAAFDLAREARAAFPDDVHLVLLATLALMRCGALLEGRELLASHQGRLGLGDETPKLVPSLAELRQADRLDASHNWTLAPLLTEIYVQSWLRLGRGDDLARARDVQVAIYQATGDRIALASAAVLSWHLGGRVRAREIARKALSGRDLVASGRLHCRALATVTLAALLAGEGALAKDALAAAVEAAGHRHMLIAETRADLQRLAAGGLTIDESVMALVTPPVLAVFTGQHLVATAGRAEQHLAMEIRLRLAELCVRIGYASAAAGPDLLFVEAMLERGAEVHVLLPFAEADFVALRVEPAGDGWLRRFEDVLERATSVTRISASDYLGDDVVFRYANQVMDGTARLHARMLGTDPYLIAAWDYLAMNTPGGASDFIDHWGDPARLRVIDLDEIVGADTGIEAPGPARPPPATPDRQSVAAMMFADIVGFSRLTDLHVSRLWSFMEGVQKRMFGKHPPCRLIDSWGDGLLVVMDTALGLVDYAMALNDALAGGDAESVDLPLRPQLRIGLHAGPVMETDHPLTGQRLIYGSNVTRAARIEPISVPGKIYASQQFVALLTAEESAHRHEAELSGGDYVERYLVEYVGVQVLPKGFGEQAIYVIHHPQTRSAKQPVAPGWVAGLG